MTAVLFSLRLPAVPLRCRTGVTSFAQTIFRLAFPALRAITTMLSGSHILVFFARCFSACAIVLLVAAVVGLHGRGASQPAALRSASLIARFPGSPLEQLLGGAKRRPGRKKLAG
eukprot:1476505-Pyramimonas_sp.AAC.1